MNTNTRLKKLEAQAVEQDAAARVVVAARQADGTVRIGGEVFTQEQAEVICRGARVVVRVGVTHWRPN